MWAGGSEFPRDSVVELGELKGAGVAGQDRAGIGKFRGEPHLGSSPTNDVMPRFFASSLEIHELSVTNQLLGYR